MAKHGFDPRLTFTSALAEPDATANGPAGPWLISDVRQIDMIITRIAISLIALLVGGWLTFDGTRALVSGDYFTPRSGPSAGQLGPWAKVVATVGVDPRSTVVKCAHLFLGILWLVALLMFFTRSALGWYALVSCSVLSLWYLPVGTALSVIELCLLFLPVTRSLR